MPNQRTFLNTKTLVFDYGVISTPPPVFFLPLHSLYCRSVTTLRRTLNLTLFRLITFLTPYFTYRKLLQLEVITVVLVYVYLSFSRLITFLALSHTHTELLQLEVIPLIVVYLYLSFHTNLIPYDGLELTCYSYITAILLLHYFKKSYLTRGECLYVEVIMVVLVYVCLYFLPNLIPNDALGWVFCMHITALLLLRHRQFFLRWFFFKFNFVQINWFPKIVLHA